jgi:hypothetical protein
MPLIVKAGVDIDPFIMGKGQIVTLWRRVLSEKLVIPELVETFPTFYGTTFTEPVAGPYSVPEHKIIGKAEA